MVKTRNVMAKSIFKDGASLQNGNVVLKRMVELGVIEEVPKGFEMPRHIIQRNQSKMHQRLTRVKYFLENGQLLDAEDLMTQPMV